VFTDRLRILMFPTVYYTSLFRGASTRACRVHNRVNTLNESVHTIVNAARKVRAPN
jgi:hypothetical protein